MQKSIGIASLWLLATVALTSAGAPAPEPVAEPVVQSPQGGRARGAKVTFSPVRKDAGAPHTQRARLLSLAVERGETPTPFLAPGGFRAEFATVLTLPARDRIRFRLSGRGKVTLKLNGKVVLEGSMRGKKDLETEKPIRLKKGENDLSLSYQSLPMGDGELRTFWSGVDFGFEPIAPELLSYDPADTAVAGGEQLRAGLQLFSERRCARCHDYDQRRVAESAFSDLDRAAPDLRNVGSRTRPGWLQAWMQRPHELRHDVTMPKFALSAQDAVDIGVYLGGLGEAPPNVAFTAEQAATGAVRFREFGCVACHAEPSESKDEAALGNRIPLKFVPQKWHAAALIGYLQNPQRHYPDVRMPNLKLTKEDAASLAAFLLQGGQALGVAKGDAKKARRVVQKHGCTLCHTLGEDVPVSDRIFPRYRNLDPERGCLSEEANHRGAPDHNFTAEQREAVRAFLPHANEVPFRRAPMDFFARHFTSDRCYACHSLDGEPSTWVRMVERLSQQAALPKEQDPTAQGVPALTWVGAKLQPSWIRDFVTGKLESPRPWLTARMPAFERHGVALSAGLAREHGYTSRDEPVRPGNAQLAIHGQRLIGAGTGFNCTQCHALGNQKATQVFEREGIELVLSRKRLRHEYYTRWLADPTRLDPDSRMPKFANRKGKTAFTDVLEGDAAKQFEAIWQFLGDRAK